MTSGAFNEGETAERLAVWQARARIDSTAHGGVVQGTGVTAIIKGQGYLRGAVTSNLSFLFPFCLSKGGTGPRCNDVE